MIVAKGKWQKVAISGCSFSQKDFDGLISIEELCDYELETEHDAATTENKERTQKKRLRPKKRGKIIKKDEKMETPTTKSLKRRRNELEVSNVGEVEEFHEMKKVRLDGMEKWDGLDVPQSVLEALCELGFTQPTPIQMQCLPAAIRDCRDVVGAAETGSGKTLAFGIPLIHHILRMKSEKHDTDDTKLWYALILTPTRELALQVKRHIAAAAKHTTIKIAAIVGGMSVLKQERLLRQQPEIVVATPGRLWELLDMGDPHLSKIGDVRLLVLDEADRMVEHGHFVELVNILQKLPQPRERYEVVSTTKKKKRRNRHLLRKKSQAVIHTDDVLSVERQTFVFSATLCLPKLARQRQQSHKQDNHSIDSLMERVGLRCNPCVVDLTQQHGTAKTLTETRITCTKEEKDVYLYYFLCRHPGRTLVFANSVDCIRRLRSLFSLLLVNPLPLHAGMQQRQRLKNLERFSNDPKGLLVSSDVAARGLDILNVDHVIHYQVPHNAELYVHRSGRTARASTEGISVMLVGPEDTPHYKRICRMLNRNEDLKLFPVDMSCWVELKARVSLARTIDTKEHRMSRAKSKNDWLLKTAEAMDIDVDDDMLPDETESKELKVDQKKIRKMRDELVSLLRTPIIPSGHSIRFPTASARLVSIGLHGKESNERSALHSVKLS